MKSLRIALALAALTIVSQAYADCVLRQSTASQELALPRFVDSTDGVTAETGLTIANTDIKLTKSGGTTQANKNSGGATHIATGDYYTVLDATDTDTVGNLHIVIGVSGALPVWVDCLVVEEAIYDGFYAASALGYIANAPVNVAQFGGSNGTFSSGRPEVNATHLAGSSLATLTGSYPALGIKDSGTAQAGSTSTTLVLRSAANFVGDNRIDGANCAITGGTGIGEALTVASYVNATDTATMNGTWPTTPDDTSTYVCWDTAPGTLGTDAITDTTLSAAAGTELATAAWAAATRTLTAATNLTTALATPTNITAGTITTVTNLTNAPTSGDLTATMKTSVQTAVLTAQGVLTGTCDSGSTTTCVDDALTQAAAEQLEDRLICFSDGWCGLITTFTPASDTATTTKIAPSTRASKTYTIFPSTLE